MGTKFNILIIFSLARSQLHKANGASVSSSTMGRAATTIGQISHSLNSARHAADSLAAQNARAQKQLATLDKAVETLDRIIETQRLQHLDAAAAVERVSRQRRELDAELKNARLHKSVAAKKLCSLQNQLDAVRLASKKQHDKHKDTDDAVATLANRLEIVAREAEVEKAKAISLTNERKRYADIYDGMRRELTVTQAADAATAYAVSHSSVH